MPVPQLRRILFVEDELDIQMVARLALRDIGGFEVEVCSSGIEALEKAPEFLPELILLDVMMPALDGPRDAQGNGPSAGDGGHPGGLRHRQGAEP